MPKRRYSPPNFEKTCGFPGYAQYSSIVAGTLRFWASLKGQDIQLRAIPQLAIETKQTTQVGNLSAGGNTDYDASSKVSYSFTRFKSDCDVGWLVFTNDNSVSTTALQNLSFSTLGDEGDTSAGDTDIPFSVSFWIKNIKDASGIQRTKHVYTKGTYGDYEYYTIVEDWDTTIASGYKIRFILYDEGSDGTQNGYVEKKAILAYEFDKWYHVTMTYDGRGGATAHVGMNIYIDGVRTSNGFAGDGDYRAMSPRYSEPFILGNNSESSTGLALSGEISELLFWAIELSPSEVNTVYTVSTEGTVTSGFTSNPPRTQLVTRDNRSGAYPVAKNYAQSGFKGTNTLKPYNDEQTVIFHDSFSRIKVRYEELPNDAQALRVSETPHVRPYDLNRDFICQFTSNTYDLRGFGSSLVGWWRMSGTPGQAISSITDLSPAGVNATQGTSAEQPVFFNSTANPSLSSTSAKFNRDDEQKLVIGSSGYWNSIVGPASTNKKVSFSLWVKLPDGAPGTGYGFITLDNAGRFEIGLSGGASMTGAGPYARKGALNLTIEASTGAFYGWYVDELIGESEGENVWHHIAVTFDHGTAASEPSFYIDGVSIPIYTMWTDAAWTGTAATLTGTGEIGHLNSTGNRHLAGDLASISVFNRILSSDEVTRIYQMGLRSRALYKSSGDLQGWWTLDKDVSASGDVTDRSGKGRTGTFPLASDRPAFSALTPAIPVAAASNTFDGSGFATDNINIGATAVWEPVIGTNGSNEITIAAWVRPLSAGEGTYGRILDLLGGYFLYLLPAGRVSFSYQTTITDGYWDTLDPVFGDYSSAYEEWCHIVVTYDRNSTSNSATFYINGLAVNTNGLTTQPTGTPVFLTTPAVIGNIVADTRAFDGQIAAVAVWDKALGPEEAYALYNAQSGAYGRSTNFEFQQGVILQPGNTEVNLKNIPQSDVKRLRGQIKRQLSSKGVTPSSNELNNLAKAQIAVDRLAKKINEQKFSGVLKVTAKASGNELEIKQCMTGSVGNTPVSYENVYGPGVSPILITESNKRFSRVDFTGDRSTKVRAASVDMFGGSSDLMNYSTGLSVDSYWTKHPEKNDLVDSPNITGSIEISGETRKGVADYGLDFSMTPYEPFVENLIPVEDDEFFNTGTPDQIVDKFQSPTRDKVAIVIDCNPSAPTEFGFTSANRYPLDGDGNSGNRGPQVMCYYNFNDKVWEPIGRGLFDRYSTAAASDAVALNSMLPSVEDFIDTACIGFSRGLEIPVEAVNASCRPTNAYGFPYHPKFNATGSQCLKMSDYISRPFVLEKYEYHFSGSFQPGNYSGFPSAMLNPAFTTKTSTPYGLPNTSHGGPRPFTAGFANQNSTTGYDPAMNAEGAAVRFATAEYTAGATATAQAANDDRFMINIPRAGGGSATDTTIIFKSSMSGTPGANEIFVKLETATSDTNANLRGAIGSILGGESDTAKVKYGTNAGSSTAGLFGVWALPAYLSASYDAATQPGKQDYGAISLSAARSTVGILDISLRNPTLAEHTNTRNIVGEYAGSPTPRWYKSTDLAGLYGEFAPATSVVEKNILAPFTHRAAINTFFIMKQENARFSYEESHRPQRNIRAVTNQAFSTPILLGPITGTVPTNIQLTPLSFTRSVAAGKFIVGKRYRVSTVGSSTNWSAWGGPNPASAGLDFTATAAGSGDGIALQKDEDIYVSSNRELVTYGQWVSYCAYTGSADITYVDSLVNPGLFQTTTVGGSDQRRIIFGDWIPPAVDSNAHYSASTIDTLGGDYSMDSLLQAGLGRELNVYSDGQASTLNIQWVSNTPDHTTGYRAGNAITVTPNNLNSYSSRLFNVLSPTGSYVMKGHSKIWPNSYTASIGGISIITHEYSGLNVHGASIANSWHGNRTGLMSVFDTRGVVANMVGSKPTGKCISVPEGNSIPGFTAYTGPPSYQFLQPDVSSPYILDPSDSIVLGWQMAMPRSMSPYSGSSLNDTASTIGPNMTLSPGAGKLILYGSFIKDNEEQLGSMQQNLDSAAIHQAIGNDPVSDQFEVAPNSAYFGSMAEQVVTGTMRQEDLGRSDGSLRPALDTADYNARGIDIEFTGRYWCTYNQSGVTNGTWRSSRKVRVGVGGNTSFDTNFHWQWPNTINGFNFASFGAIQKTAQLIADETYYDSTPGSPTLYHQTDGKKAIYMAEADIAGSFHAEGFYLPIVAAEAGTEGFVTGNPDYGMSDNFLDKVANFAWQRGFPFENRYKGIPRRRTTRQFDESIKIDWVKIGTPTESKGNFVEGTSPVSVNSVGLFLARQTYNPALDMIVYPGPRFSPIGSIYYANWYGSWKTPIMQEKFNQSWFMFGDSEGTNNQHIPAYPGLRFDGANYYPYAVFKPRGYKYGLIAANTLNSSAHFRRDRFGQLRDMMEQRPYTRYYSEEKLFSAPVQARFVDRETGLVTNPMNTVCQNVSPVMSSSLPYFDGVARSRGDNPDAANDLSVTIGLL